MAASRVYVVVVAPDSEIAVALAKAAGATEGVRSPKRKKAAPAGKKKARKAQPAGDTQQGQAPLRVITPKVTQPKAPKSNRKEAM
jgi:hypothetical protein